MNKDIVQIGEAIHDALRKFVSEHEGWDIYENLSGGCAIASYFLVQHVKKQLSLIMEFKANSGHAWAERAGYVYDITYCQFDDTSPKVYVIPEAKKEDCHYNDDGKDLHHIQTTWPTAQRPRNYRLRWQRKDKCRLYVSPTAEILDDE